MCERHELDTAAEALEAMALFDALTVFAERDKVNGVLASEFAQKVERALIGAAIEGKWDVRIDDKEIHDGEMKRGLAQSASPPSEGIS